MKSLNELVREAVRDYFAPLVWGWNRVRAYIAHEEPPMTSAKLKAFTVDIDFEYPDGRVTTRMFGVTCTRITDALGAALHNADPGDGCIIRSARIRELRR